MAGVALESCEGAAELAEELIEGAGWPVQAPLSEQSRLIIEDQLEDLKTLERRLAKVEGRLTSLSEGDPIVRKLLAEPGIGPVTAWTLRAEVGRFERFPSGKHLSRFCGVSPRNASTGVRQADAGLIKAGNPQLRATLIEVAHPLIRLQPRWRKLAARLADRATRATGGLAAGRMGKATLPGLR